MSENVDHESVKMLPSSSLSLEHSNHSSDDVDHSDKAGNSLSGLLEFKLSDDLSASEEDCVNGNYTAFSDSKPSDLTLPNTDLKAKLLTINIGNEAREINKQIAENESILPESVGNHDIANDNIKGLGAYSLGRLRQVDNNVDTNVSWDSDSALLNSERSANKNAGKSVAQATSSWRKLNDSGGTYYWNIETGVTQYDLPPELGSDKEESDDESAKFHSVDSSLADLEGAAFRYASLTLGSEDSTSESSTKWAGDSDTGCMFSVRSLGWLPLDACSSDPGTSSADVNACIRHLSRSHGQIMDGIGAWGDGKNLLLLIEDQFLKLLDPLNQTVLQTQPIKQIRIWGVGHDSAHDFAYVAKDPLSKTYKCHVFRCDASAKAIARELHQVCESLSLKHKKQLKDADDEEKEKLAMSTPIPVPKSAPGQLFSVKYLGSKKVTAVNGINTIKNVIRDITTSNTALCKECTVNLSSNALLITSSQDNRTLVDCRMRCLSFMGIGDDICLFAFISVVAGDATCHVLQCDPNAIKFALAVQEACVLRFQKAVDSNDQPNTLIQDSGRPSSVRQFMKKLFTSKKK